MFLSGENYKLEAKKYIHTSLGANLSSVCTLVVSGIFLVSLLKVMFFSLTEKRNLVFSFAALRIYSCSAFKLWIG